MGEDMCKAFPPSLPQLLIEDAVRAALLEDLGRAGDITTNATLPEDAIANAGLSSREAGTICGIDFARTAFALMDPKLKITALVRDGARVEPGEDIARIEGNARAILSAERVALNFVQHLSGIATATNAFVRKASGTKTRICCTRKTTPGLRALEK